MPKRRKVIAVSDNNIDNDIDSEKGYSDPLEEKKDE